MQNFKDEVLDMIKKIQSSERHISLFRFFADIRLPLCYSAAMYILLQTFLKSFIDVFFCKVTGNFAVRVFRVSGKTKRNIKN